MFGILMDDKEIYKQFSRLLFEHSPIRDKEIRAVYIMKKVGMSYTFWHGDNPKQNSFRFPGSCSPEALRLLKELREYYRETGKGDWNITRCRFDPLKPSISFDFEFNDAVVDGTFIFQDYMKTLEGYSE